MESLEINPKIEKLINDEISQLKQCKRSYISIWDDVIESDECQASLRGYDARIQTLVNLKSVLSAEQL